MRILSEGRRCSLVSLHKLEDVAVRVTIAILLLIHLGKVIAQAISQLGQ